MKVGCAGFAVGPAPDIGVLASQLDATLAGPSEPGLYYAFSFAVGTVGTAGSER